MEPFVYGCAGAMSVLIFQAAIRHGLFCHIGWHQWTLQHMFPNSWRFCPLCKKTQSLSKDT